MIGRPEVGIVWRRAVKAQAGTFHGDGAFDPDIIDAAIEARPFRMGRLAVGFAERRERRGLALRRSKTLRHELDRRLKGLGFVV